MWHVAWVNKLPRKIVGVEYYMLGAFRGKIATCWRRKVLFPRVRVGKGKLYFVKLGFWKFTGWSYLASSVIALHSLFLCHLGTRWMAVTQWQLRVCYVSEVLGSLRWTNGLDAWGQDEPSSKDDEPLAGFSWLLPWFWCRQLCFHWKTFEEDTLWVPSFSFPFPSCGMHSDQWPCNFPVHSPWRF